METVGKTRVHIDTIKQSFDLIDKINSFKWEDLEFFDKEGAKVDITKDFGDKSVNYETNCHFIMKHLEKAPKT